MAKGADSFLKIGTAGVTINQNRFTRCPAEQLIKRDVQALGFDVPKSRVYGSNRAHGDRPTPPVCALVEILPGILDLARIAANQDRNHVIGEIAGDGQLAAVESGVAKTV